MTLLDLCEAPAPEGDDFVAKVARHFMARPGQWVDYRELATVGGFGAWRTRVSDARHRYAMTIENRSKRHAGHHRGRQLADEGPPLRRRGVGADAADAARCLRFGARRF